MKTIQIQVNNKIYYKLMSILSQFNSKDLKVLNDEVYENDKNYLEAQLKVTKVVKNKKKQLKCIKLYHLYISTFYR